MEKNVIFTHQNAESMMQNNTDGAIEPKIVNKFNRYNLHVHTSNIRYNA